METHSLVRIAPDIDIRTEHFGSLVYRKSIGKVYQFNADGFYLLSKFLSPITISEMLAAISNHQKILDVDSLRSFIFHCFEQGIIEFTEDNGKSRSLIGEGNYPTSEKFLKAPFGCTIYITDLCPKACRHCITTSSPKASTEGDLTTAEWKKVFDILRDAGVMQVIITGGDPMTREDIWDILSYADEKGFYISLLTDFDDLTESDILRFKEFENLRYLQTSLDGGTAATHDYIRGKGSYERTIKRLSLFAKHGIKYTLSSSIFHRNLSEVYQIAEISKRYNAESLYLNPIAPYGRASRLPKEQLLNSDELSHLATMYFDLISNYNIDSGNSYWQETVSRGLEKFQPDVPFKGILDGVTIATALCSLNSRGDIYLDSKLKAEGLLKLGNILRDGIIVPWQSSILDTLRQNFVPSEPLKLVPIDFVRNIQFLNT